LRNILSILPKPSHYIGIEEGSTHKNLCDVRLRVALAFPDMYEVGMSYLGQKLLYGLINEHEGWAAERVFTPDVQGGGILKTNSAPLCSLESDTPLAEFDVLGFSVTHELCYTNILYMLDLAGIPFYSSERKSNTYPLIVAGGGCTLAAEAIAPFFDVMCLGDGEEMLPDLLQLLEKAKAELRPKNWILEQASKIPGLYIPEFFKSTGTRTPPLPLKPDYTSVTRRVLQSLDNAYYPLRQPVPFGAVHNRLTLEIARGCTRSCRFCQAGMLYRPVRERSLENLENLMEKCLNSTGYDDISYLSLSTGDFSALKTFFTSAIERCAREQISVSLPSLRIGSIDDSIMESMAGIRRTGATLAPEAGSQRLREVINKGITEEEIILHTQKLFEHGWQQIKLYFMLGLPTETDEDLYAIIDLCRKVRDAAGPGIKRLQVTASISIFVPKPHTPFQWEDQISIDEMQRRIDLLLNAAKAEKRIKIRWHKPQMSFLEGIFSRSDRRLAPVIESAYRKGALFTAWIDQFQLEPWLEAMQEQKLEPKEFTAGFALDAALPWEHLDSRVSTEFLLKERAKGFAATLTPDCRYDSCQGCGVCADGLSNVLNFKERDQSAHKPRLDAYGRVITRENQAGPNGQDNNKNAPPVLSASLVAKVNHYRIWYSKKEQAVFISQLEIQAIFERALRRGALPLAFSQGFNPAPLLSFARALPVGVASNCEWLSLYLREARKEEEVWKAFKELPPGLRIEKVTKLPLGQRPEESISETYLVQWSGQEERKNLFTQAIEVFSGCSELPWIKKGKKHDKELDIKAIIPVVRPSGTKNIADFEFVFDWSNHYTSPLALTLAALGLSLPEQDENAFSSHEFLLTKINQT
jgi:radical SAM family uncharacterized protein/radical SAM-linked protein